MNIKSIKFICLVIGAILGMSVWFLSPYVTGEIEPWDGGVYYWAALFFSGFVGYAIYPKSMFATIGGIYAGQLFYLLIIGMGPLFLVGTILLAIYSVVALAGAWLYKLLLDMSYKKPG